MRNTYSTLLVSLGALGCGFVLFKALQNGKRLNPMNIQRLKVIERSLLINGYSPDVAKTSQAIAIHESGWFSNRISKENHNPWGMKGVSKRPTTQIGVDKQGFGIYRNFQDAVDDFILYLQDWKYPKDQSSISMVTMMKDKGYYEDSFQNYWNGVQRALKQLG